MNPIPWTAVRGAGRFMKALAKGETATPEDAERRTRSCAGCATLTIGRVPAVGFVAFCGPAPAPGVTPEEGRYCCCLRGWIPASEARALRRDFGHDRQALERAIRAKLRPAGANVVKSYGCPQGRAGHPQGCKGCVK